MRGNGTALADFALRERAGCIRRVVFMTVRWSRCPDWMRRNGASFPKTPGVAVVLRHRERGQINRLRRSFDTHLGGDVDLAVRLEREPPAPRGE